MAPTGCFVRTHSGLCQRVQPPAGSVHGPGDAPVRLRQASAGRVGGQSIGRLTPDHRVRGTWSAHRLACMPPGTGVLVAHGCRAQHAGGRLPPRSRRRDRRCLGCAVAAGSMSVLVVLPTLPPDLVRCWSGSWAATIGPCLPGRAGEAMFTSRHDASTMSPAAGLMVLLVWRWAGTAARRRWRAEWATGRSCGPGVSRREVLVAPQPVQPVSHPHCCRTAGCSPARFAVKDGTCSPERDGGIRTPRPLHRSSKARSPPCCGSARKPSPIV